MSFSICSFNTRRWNCSSACSTPRGHHTLYEGVREQPAAHLRCQQQHTAQACSRCPRTHAHTHTPAQRAYPHARHTRTLLNDMPWPPRTRTVTVRALKLATPPGRATALPTQDVSALLHSPAGRMGRTHCVAVRNTMRGEASMVPQRCPSRVSVQASGQPSLDELMWWPRWDLLSDDLMMDTSDDAMTGLLILPKTPQPSASLHSGPHSCRCDYSCVLLATHTVWCGRGSATLAACCLCASTDDSTVDTVIAAHVRLPKPAAQAGCTGIRAEPAGLRPAGGLSVAVCAKAAHDGGPTGAWLAVSRVQHQSTTPCQHEAAPISAVQLQEAAAACAAGTGRNAGFHGGSTPGMWLGALRYC